MEYLEKKGWSLPKMEVLEVRSTFYDPFGLKDFNGNGNHNGSINGKGNQNGTGNGGNGNHFGWDS